MTLKEALIIVELSPDASLEDIKRAYRRLAFALHPDLNPGMPDAGKRFQRLNEAYVFLCDVQSTSTQRTATTNTNRAESEATEKARADARRAYARAQERAAKAEQQARKNAQAAQQKEQQNGQATGNGDDASRESVLRDLLRDPFARRVFEDIYSQIRHEASKVTRAGRTAGKRSIAATSPLASWGGKTGRVVDSVRGWLQRQVDEDMTVYLPGPSLVPGARVRLQVRHGFAGKAKTIELTLPPEFIVGRPIRLKGMGKRVGAWIGDLYLRLLPRELEGKSQ